MFLGKVLERGRCFGAFFSVLGNDLVERFFALFVGNFHGHNKLFLRLGQNRKESFVSHDGSLFEVRFGGDSGLVEVRFGSDSDFVDMRFGSSSRLIHIGFGGLNSLVDMGLEILLIVRTSLDHSFLGQRFGLFHVLIGQSDRLDLEFPGRDTCGFLEFTELVSRLFLVDHGCRGYILGNVSHVTVRAAGMKIFPMFQSLKRETQVGQK